jgi:Winged helix-turn helix
MPLSRAVPVTLTAAERTRLEERARGAKTAHRDRLRAQIVLAAARGRDNARIAADLRVTADTVRKWRGRFAVRGLAGLADLPRSGRPRRISELTRAAALPGRVAAAADYSAAAGRDVNITASGGGVAAGVIHGNVAPLNPPGPGPAIS